MGVTFKSGNGVWVGWKSWLINLIDNWRLFWDYFDYRFIVLFSIVICWIFPVLVRLVIRSFHNIKWTNQTIKNIMADLSIMKWIMFCNPFKKYSHYFWLKDDSLSVFEIFLNLGFTERETTSIVICLLKGINRYTVGISLTLNTSYTTQLRLISLC